VESLEGSFSSLKNEGNLLVKQERFDTLPERFDFVILHLFTAVKVVKRKLKTSKIYYYDAVKNIGTSSCFLSK